MAVAVALAYQIFEWALESAGVHLEQAPHALRAFVSSHQAVSYGLLGAAGVLLAINCYYTVATHQQRQTVMHSLLCCSPSSSPSG